MRAAKVADKSVHDKITSLKKSKQLKPGLNVTTVKTLERKDVITE